MSRTLTGKTVLVTGATRGIGYATAEALARMGARVIVHGRDPDRLERVRRALTRAAPGAEIESAVADLSSLAAVRSLADELKAKHPRLDVLINNAGLVTRKREQTVDGLERQLAVNHLAPFLLTQLLLETLMASAPARVVTVSSMAHHRADFDLTDLNWERRRYSGIGAYGASKLANILFTRELARRLEGTGVTANCLHPGVVGTHIFAGMGVLGALFGIASRPFMRSLAQGAATPIYLASASEVEQLSGQFFNDEQAVEPAPAARDDAAALALWQASEQLAGLA